MPALARGQASNCSNPELDLFTKVNGVLTDVDTLEFIIFDEVTTPGTPIQTYPPSGRASVDVDNLCPTGQKISTGRFVAIWTPPLTQAIGTHSIQWFFKLTASSPEQTFTEEFEVLPEVTGGATDGYCSVQKLRDAGVTVAQASDAQLQQKISLASKWIDKLTGRFFEPRTKTIRVDGTGARGLLLGDPIISISEIKLISDDSIVTNPIDLNDVRIYNRHMTQGLFDPDDRESPKIEFLMFDERHEHLPVHVHEVFHPHRWPKGTQNVEITGVFGYTDPDGTTNGQTPDLICEACTLMVIRFFLSTPAEGASDDANAWRVTEYKTRDQTIKFADPAKLGSAGVGAFTGDPQIDRILAMYARPPALGAT